MYLHWQTPGHQKAASWPLILREEQVIFHCRLAESLIKNCKNAEESIPTEHVRCSELLRAIAVVLKVSPVCQANSLLSDVHSCIRYRWLQGSTKSVKSQRFTICVVAAQMDRQQMRQGFGWSTGLCSRLERLAPLCFCSTCSVPPQCEWNQHESTMGLCARWDTKLNGPVPFIRAIPVHLRTLILWRCSSEFFQVQAQVTELLKTCRTMQYSFDPRIQRDRNMNRALTNLFGLDLAYPVKHMKVCIGGSALKTRVNQERPARAPSISCLSTDATPMNHAMWKTTTPRQARLRRPEDGSSQTVDWVLGDGSTHFDGLSAGSALSRSASSVTGKNNK